MTNDWHKSSFSGSSANCVEVREHATGADVRDTQNRADGHLSVPTAEWAALIVRVRADQ